MPDYKLITADISPFAQRVVMQLDYKGIPYSASLPPGGLKSDEFGKLNPIQKIPVLVVGDRVIPESEVICEYIEEMHPEPPLLPADPDGRAQCRLISRIADQYVMNPMMPLFKNLSRKNRNMEVVQPALDAIDRGLSSLNAFICPGPYALGDTLSLCDFATAPILRYVQQYLPYFGIAEPLAPYDRVAKYVGEVRKDARVDAGISRIEAGWAALAKAHK